VDLETSLKEGADLDWWRQRGWGDCLRVVYMGAHGRVNGLQFLVEAAARLGPKEGIKLVLVGDGAEKPRLVAEAKDRKLEQIIFHPPVKRECVPGILKAADVGLMIERVTPGSELCMPNKFFDYLAAGLPIISNNPAEYWEHIRAAECGLLADHNRPESLVELLRQLRDNPRLRQEMRRRALALAQQRFDRRQLNREWEEVLLKAAGKEEVRED